MMALQQNIANNLTTKIIKQLRGQIQNNGRVVPFIAIRNIIPATDSSEKGTRLPLPFQFPVDNLRTGKFVQTFFFALCSGLINVLIKYISKGAILWEVEGQAVPLEIRIASQTLKSAHSRSTTGNPLHTTSTLHIAESNITQSLGGQLLG